MGALPVRGWEVSSHIFRRRRSTRLVSEQSEREFNCCGLRRGLTPPRVVLLHLLQEAYLPTTSLQKPTVSDMRVVSLEVVGGHRLSDLYQNLFLAFAVAKQSALCLAPLQNRVFNYERFTRHS